MYLRIIPSDLTLFPLLLVINSVPTRFALYPFYFNPSIPHLRYSLTHPFPSRDAQRAHLAPR
jgi:hypothetical protein